MKQLTVGIIISIFSLLSCQSNSTSPDKEVVAEVKGKYLYLIDVQDALPGGLNNKDSAAFAKEFVANWISDELMYDVARRNIPDEDKVNELVEEYRRQLVTNEYQRYLVEEKLSNEISDEEIEAYYHAHKSEMVLKKDQIKGLFLKIPANAPQHNLLHNWMTLKKPDFAEKIDQYSIEHAVAYEGFLDRWVDFETIMTNIPYSISNTALFLKQNKQLEVKDSAFIYLLTIKNYAIAGTPFPEELAKEEAKAELVSQRKVKYLQDFRNTLLKKATENKSVVVYTRQ
ncbi:MAG: peptidyl-prolyl cis-trans isomerase [Bacteroidales bacterium]|nr:peptidyl-prolyl cis-trans isomerase [Bacteroidales bacterium]